MKRFEGQVAVVTGGSSGIGRATCIRLADEGACVIAVGRKEDELKKTAEANGNISYVVADLTKTEDVTRVAEAARELGRLDLLVNNAGWCPVQPIKEVTLEDYDRAFGLDVRSLVDMTIQTLPLIIESKGSIVNMSTVGTTHRAANLSMYQGAKAAVENFTRVWAIELAADGVRVNAVAPGAIDTNIWNVTDLSEEEAAKHKEGLASSIPAKRMGRPEEIASMIAYLASDEADYISGAVMCVDGAMGAA